MRLSLSVNSDLHLGINGYKYYDVDETDNFNKYRWCASENTEEV